MEGLSLALDEVLNTFCTIFRNSSYKWNVLFRLCIGILTVSNVVRTRLCHHNGPGAVSHQMFADVLSQNPPLGWASPYMLSLDGFK